MSDDRELVARARVGDTDAFTALLRSHDANMRGVAWRLVGSQNAMDDVLQDAYLKAWDRLHTFRGDSAFSSWLYRIVHTTSLDHLKAARRRPIVPGAGDLERRVDDPAVGVVWSLALRDALATLPPDQLAVVAMIDGEGQSYEAVAQMLGISAGTVASRLHRARKALRAQLTDNDEGVQ